MSPDVSGGWARAADDKSVSATIGRVITRMGASSGSMIRLAGVAQIVLIQRNKALPRGPEWPDAHRRRTCRRAH